MPANAAAAFGEEIGKLFEEAILKGLSEDVKTRHCKIRPAKMKNGTGNVYQIDAVVFDKDENPLVIIDPKYIRYTSTTVTKVAGFVWRTITCEKRSPLLENQFLFWLGDGQSHL